MREGGDLLGQSDNPMRKKHSQKAGLMDVAGQNTEE